MDPVQLRVRLPTGGDPIFPLVVRLSGETVQGTSGSFREFILYMCKDLRSSALNLLCECPSAASGRNQGRLMLRTGSLAGGEDKLLEFFGVLIGISLRADVPLPLDLLPSFWKCLIGIPLGAVDVSDCDKFTGDLLHRLEALSSPEAFEEFMAIHQVTTSVHTLSGEDVNLVLSPEDAVRRGRGAAGAAASSAAGGAATNAFTPEDECEDDAGRLLQWADVPVYVSKVRAMRLEELRNAIRFAAIRRGLSSIVPMDALSLLSWEDMELRVCGLPEIDLGFLREHTHYQVGLSDTDQHVQYFWRALESFSVEERRMFVKFACNQDRIPSTCSCKKQGSGNVHVPPYPMKIAPPDGSGPADKRFIRAETCMFMVKLPQYSSQALMTDRLRYAIHHCREDPLSG